jgi:hypothetical protein
MREEAETGLAVLEAAEEGLVGQDSLGKILLLEAMAV